LHLLSLVDGFYFFVRSLNAYTRRGMAAVHSIHSCLKLYTAFGSKRCSLAKIFLRYTRSTTRASTGKSAPRSIDYVFSADERNPSNFRPVRAVVLSTSQSNQDEQEGALRPHFSTRMKLFKIITALSRLKLFMMFLSSMVTFALLSLL